VAAYINYPCFENGRQSCPHAINKVPFNGIMESRFKLSETP